MTDVVVVVGNCQASAIEMMLATNPEFGSRFRIESFPPVHEIPDEDVPRLHETVASAALVVPQRVEEGYREGIGLGTKTISRLAGRAQVVRWPSVYWAGYFPDLFYLRDADGQPVVDGPFDYHDRAILRAFADGSNVTGTVRALCDPERPSTAPQWAAEATAELASRGADCDVDVAPFIAQRFREQLLFFTMNHPANELLGFIAQRVTELAGIPGQVEPTRIPDEVLSSTFYPLHAGDARSLGLVFAAKASIGGCAFRIRGRELSAEEAVASFFTYYEANPSLVELNVG